MHTEGRFNYVSSFDIIKYGDASIELAATVGVDELLQMEQQVIEEYGVLAVNRKRAARLRELECKYCNKTLKATSWRTHCRTDRHLAAVYQSFIDEFACMTCE